LTKSPIAVADVASVDSLRGEQWPQKLHLPMARWTPAPEDGCAALDALELAEANGVLLDPWQELSVNAIMWEREDGRWAATDVGILVARQNGKGEILLVRQLYGLYVARENLMVHSAHEFKTADEAYRRIREIIEGSDDLSSRVKRMNESHGEEGVELLPDATIITGAASSQVRQSRSPRLRFIARSGGSGRGFTCDTLMWDEAYDLPQPVVNAQRPMLSAVHNPQIIYTSSAVDQTIHKHGAQLAMMRKRALDAIADHAPHPDPPTRDDEICDGPPPGEYESESEPRMAWCEWVADEERWWKLVERGQRRLMKALTREPEQWAAANPGMPLRLTAEKIGDEVRGMTPRTAAVERLNIGDWPKVDDEQTVVDMVRWADIADPASRPMHGRISLAIEVSSDRKWGCIASAGAREDERHHVKIVDHREGTHWIVDRIVDLVARYSVVAVTIDPSSQAGSLIEPLVTAGILEKIKGVTGRHIHRVTARDVAQACGAFFDEIDPKHDTLRHCDQGNLTDSLQEAQTRALADAWAWSRKEGTDISPVMASTLALHGWRVYGRTGTMPWASRG
jgi:hypothetical protein